LVAGTHGRGFWILDDVTPLRQAVEAAAALKAYLFKPATGIRIRFGTNDPTPWPPELPAGENPPPGAIVDYYLPSGVDDVKLEVLNAESKVIRTYSSSDPVRKPDPATDPVAYNKVCQAMPSAQDCGLPLYWPAPPQILKTSAGMHRFTWDIHYDPIPGTPAARGGDADGAVPHRTYPVVNAPWAAPGVYTVRLTAGGQSVTQPITIRLDPRVKITPEVKQIFTLTTRIESEARNALGAAASTKDEKLAGELKEMAGQLVASVMSMQGSEMAPTASELEACTRQEAAYSALMKRLTK
jgi:hypothetical protein